MRRPDFICKNGQAEAGWKQYLMQEAPPRERELFQPAKCGVVFCGKVHRGRKGLIFQKVKKGLKTALFSFSAAGGTGFGARNRKINVIFEKNILNGRKIPEILQEKWHRCDILNIFFNRFWVLLSGQNFKILG